MKAAVLRAPGELTIEDIEIDTPMAHEVVVRTAAVGVCHSDLHFVEGLIPSPDPVVLGHEVSGVVEEVGDQVSYVRPGDRVVACLSVFCGECGFCLSGRPNLCQSPAVRRGPSDRPRLSAGGDPIQQFAELGAFAERLLVHERALVRIEPDLPLDVAALVSCGVLTGVGAVLNTARVEAGSTVAVIGAGGVGLCVIQGAVIAGASRIIAIDLLESKLRMAEAFGATDTVNGAEQDPVQAVLDLTGGGVEHAFEVIGKARTAEQAFECLGPGGTATIIGVLPPEAIIRIPGRLLLRDRKLQGCIMGGNRFRIDIPRYLDFWKQGRLKLEEMVSRRLRLEDVNLAFQAMKAGEVARSVLILDDKSVVGAPPA
jgi:S-(hydroxymethyl)glutathione dehydrogenase / alcohol dehydrogenase